MFRATSADVGAWTQKEARPRSSSRLSVSWLQVRQVIVMLVLQSDNADLGVELLEINVTAVAGVACLLEDPLPFLGSVKGAAGELPVHQVHLLTLVPIRFD